MGFGKFKNANSADLVHKIELYDFGTGDPAVLADGRRQHITIKGSKSKAWESAVEREAAASKKRGDADTFSFTGNAKILARRISEIVVSALIDVSETDEPDMIEFANIDALTSSERNAVQSKLRTLFVEVTEIATQVNDEAVKGSNFLPGRGQSLSALLSSENSTVPSQATASEIA